MLVEVFREDFVKKLICKMLALIVKSLRWEMLRRKWENKGGACSRCSERTL